MKSNTDTDLASKIRQLRIDNNLTQEQVAKALRMLVFFAKLTHTTLDSLVGCMDESYTQTALDNEIMELVSQFSDDEKRKLIDTIKLWRA